jgi:hypothetical protein
LKAPGSSGKQTESGNAGTTAQPNYTMGATQVFPNAESPITNLVEGALISPTGPVGIVTGAARAAYTGVTGDADPFTEGKQTSPFSNTGPQGGWQPDRYKGRAQQTGLGAAEGDSSGERVIAGRGYGAGTMALTGDPTDPISGGDGGDYSDEVMLRDRRKPRAAGAGTQMLLA